MNFQVTSGSGSSISIDTYPSKSRDISIDIQTYLNGNTIPTPSVLQANQTPYAMFIYFSDLLEYTELDIEREIDLNYGTRSSGSTSGGGISTLNPCLDGDVTRSSFAIATPSATGTGTDNGGNDIDTEISEF